jgi:hypothetical protein
VAKTKREPNEEPLVKCFIAVTVAVLTGVSGRLVSPVQSMTHRTWNSKAGGTFSCGVLLHALRLSAYFVLDVSIDHMHRSYAISWLHC